MSLRLSVCSTTSCQLWGEVFSSATAILFSLVARRLLIDMRPRTVRNLTGPAGLSTWRIVTVICVPRRYGNARACDHRSNEDIGRNAMARCFRTAAMAAVISVLAVAAQAQSFPAKPVHIFVPYPPGGGVDVLTRTLGDVVSKQWGQSVVVENRPGAGGVIASQAVATSPPDGYTLIMVASGHATNPSLDSKIPYATSTDCTPV